MAEKTITDAIEEQAMGPRQVTVDGASTQRRDIRELIEADKHLAAKTAAKRNHFGMAFRKLEPGGTG